MEEDDVPTQIMTLLTKDDPEPYNLSEEALGGVEAILQGYVGTPEIEGVARDVFRFCWFLDRRLNSPEAAKALIQVVMRYSSTDRAFGPGPGARIDDDTWRKLLGGDDRGLPSDEEKPEAAKKPWEILGS